MQATIAPEQLTDIPLFADLTGAECEELLQSCEELARAEGDVVFRAGEFAPALYIVLRGEVDIVLDLPGGGNVLAATIGPNGVFGETSFFHPAPHSATARCRQPTMALRLPRREFESLLANQSSAACRVGVRAAQLLAARLQATDHWLANVLGDQEQALIASWKRYREGLGASFDFPHGFVHPY